MPRLKQIKVRVTDIEFSLIKGVADLYDLPVSTFVRNKMLGIKSPTRTEAQIIDRLATLNGDLGRVGGLLKLWLSREIPTDESVNAQALLHRLGELRNDIAEAVKRL